MEPTASYTTAEAATGTDHITATPLQSHGHIPQMWKLCDGLINYVQHIAYLQQECHKSKVGIFELLV